MSRLPPIDPPYTDEVQASFQKLMPPDMEPLALFRTLAHNPRVLRRIQRGGLLDPGSISLRLRELAILRTCARCGADYEWGVHVTFFGAAAGFDDAELERIAAGPAGDSSWNEEERLVLQLCDELHDRATLSDHQWSALEETFEPAQVVELVTLAGLYHAVSFLVNALQVSPEPWAAELPAHAAELRRRHPGGSPGARARC